jgi:hypothetical protein
MMPADLVKRVVEACKWGAGREAEGFGEGVLRLMGARRTRGQTRGVLRGVRLLERAMREGEKEEQLRESERVY